MNPREKIQTKIGAALDDPAKLGQAAKTIDIEHPTTAVRTSGRGWREEWKNNEIDDEYNQVTDLKIGMLQNEIAIAPMQDGILRIGGRQYYISAFEADAVDAMWTIYARG